MFQDTSSSANESDWHSRVWGFKKMATAFSPTLATETACHTSGYQRLPLSILFSVKNISREGSLSPSPNYHPVWQTENLRHGEIRVSMLNSTSMEESTCTSVRIGAEQRKIKGTDHQLVKTQAIFCQLHSSCTYLCWLKIWSQKHTEVSGLWTQVRSWNSPHPCVRIWNSCWASEYCQALPWVGKLIGVQVVRAALATPRTHHAVPQHPLLPTWPPHQPSTWLPQNLMYLSFLHPQETGECCFPNCTDGDLPPKEFKWLAEGHIGRPIDFYPSDRYSPQHCHTPLFSLCRVELFSQV